MSAPAPNRPSADPPVTSAVVVAPSPVPMRLGGAERHWDRLCSALQERGIATDVVKLPVREDALVDLLEAYEDFATLDLSHADLVITGKYPAWMVQHPNHVVWMLHPLRGLYDTYNPAAFEDRSLPDAPGVTELLELLSGDPGVADPFAVIDAVRVVADGLGPTAGDRGGPLELPGPIARAVVHHLDRWALDPTRVATHAAISEVVARRADYFPPGVEVRVVLPPSCLPDPGDTGPPGDGFLAVGRLDPPKRLDLAIEAALSLDDPPAVLTVVGDGPDRERLGRLAGGDTRIRFAGRIDDDRLIREYRSARAVVVTPADEDFGYVAIEAMQHGRAVVTTTDAGGPAELTTDEVDSLVVEPTASAVAGAMARLARDPALAARLGEAARATAARHSWPAAVEDLLAPPVRAAAGGAGPARSGTGAGRSLLALSTYPVLGWPGGGPQRARALLGALAEEGWEVTIVCLDDEAAPGTTRVAPGLSQVVVAPSDRHRDAEARLRRVTANVSVGDIAASVLWKATPELVRALRFGLQRADGAVLVQPYLAPAVAELAPGLPVVFDAHNHERTLKAQMLPADEAGHWMLDRVAEAEGTATAVAALVAVATEDDRAALVADHDVDPGRFVVVPNGVDPGARVFTGEIERAENQAALLSGLGASGAEGLALFVGSAHRPNVEAARHIVRIARRVPEVAFVLAGAHSDLLDRHACPANVHLLGTVGAERLEELLAGAGVALNPVRSGGGSNLKLLDYFAAGVPVITSAVGARGLPRPEAVATVVDDDTVARAVVESLRAPRHDKVKAARELVETDYSWPLIGRRFARAVDESFTGAKRQHDDG